MHTAARIVPKLALARDRSRERDINGSIAICLGVGCREVAEVGRKDRFAGMRGTGSRDIGQKRAWEQGDSFVLANHILSEIK